MALVPKPSNQGKGLHETPLTLEFVCTNTVPEMNAKGEDNRGFVHFQPVSREQRVF